MMLLVDGKPVKVKNDVTVVLVNQPGPDLDEPPVDLQLKVTHEGLIIDTIRTTDNEMVGTAGYEVDDLIEMAH